MIFKDDPTGFLARHGSLHDRLTPFANGIILGWVIAYFGLPIALVLVWAIKQ